MWVPDFRKSALYQRSLDLSHEIYRTVDEDYEKIGEIEAMQLRKRAVQITKKITHSLIQQNIKMKYKNLNESKGELGSLLEQIYQLCNERKIEDWNGFIIDYYADQVMKLINYSFGKYKKNVEI